MGAPTPLLVLNGLVATGIIVVVLYTLAVFVRCSIELHQLKVETQRLRIAYLERLAALRGGGSAATPEVVGVDVVDQTPVEQPKPTPEEPTPAPGEASETAPPEPARAAA